MSSTLPSAANDYTIPLGQPATRAFLQGIFSSIGQRLREAEANEANYQAAIDLITTQALAIVSANVAEEVEIQRANVASIRQTLEALLAEYEDVQEGGIPASGIAVTPVAGLTGSNVQAVLAAAATALASLGSSSSDAADALSRRVRFDEAQALTAGQKTQALANIGAEPSLGFKPVRQGGGAGQGTNNIYIGWSGTGLKVQVDASDLGQFLITGTNGLVKPTQSALRPDVFGELGSTVYAYSSAPTTYGSQVAGSSLQYQTVQGSFPSLGLAGTWQQRGNITTQNNASAPGYCLFVRIA